MDSRGQVSAEYIFLILIFLIVIMSVTVPFAGRAISSSQDVSITSDAQTALSSIVNAVNVVYSNGPGAKRTVSVYIPQDTQLVSDNANKILKLNLQDIPVSASDESVLKENVNLPIPYDVDVNVPGDISKGWHNFVIYWPVDADTIITEPISITIAS